MADEAAEQVVAYLDDADPMKTPLAQACAVAGDRAPAGFAAYLVAGAETTVTLLNNLVLYWLTYRPDSTTAAARRAVVEEVLRLEPPANAVTRYVPEDRVLGGHNLRADQIAHVAIAAANRDPASFADPHEFRPGRPQPGLMFGHGPHYCAGASLARAQGEILLELLNEQATDWRIAGRVVYGRNILLRHITHLPIALAGVNATGGSPEQ